MGQPCFLSSSIQDYHQLRSNDEFVRNAWQIIGQTLGLVFWIFLCNFVESLAFLQGNRSRSTYEATTTNEIKQLYLNLLQSLCSFWMLFAEDMSYIHCICCFETAFPLEDVAAKVSFLTTNRGSRAPSTASLLRHPQPFLYPSCCLSSCYPLTQKPSLACSTVASQSELSNQNNRINPLCLIFYEIVVRVNHCLHPSSNPRPPGKVQLWRTKSHV